MLEVCAAIIRREGKILLSQRAEPEALRGQWEFPGGKRRADETGEACIQRECLEELGLSIHIDRPLLTLPWDEGPEAIQFTFFLASLPGGAQPECRVHLQHHWALPSALSSYELCAADAAILDKIPTQ